MRRASLQVKFGLSYILVIAAVLVFMNTYPLIVSENLVVRSKQTTLQSSVSVMVTALSGLEELSEENVASAMTLVEDTGISRILVTDAAGRILYDTRETDGAVGRYGLYTEIVQALRGYDAFYADFTDGAFRSRAVIYRSQTIGAVYAYEYDVEQATLLLTLQKNLLRISAAVAGFVVLLSLLLSRILTRRFGVLLEAIRRVREGAYSYHAEIGGRDEISEIAEEFNSLSDRLQTTEEARRRFVSDASHELKTPLAGIRLLSDSILQTEDIDAATVREFVGDIVQETDRLTRITENLLRLTRLDSGIVEPAQSVAVAPVIERVVRMLRLVADEKRVELTYLVEREQSVRAGVDDLHQIIYNLTENAIKYNRPGGFVRVTLVNHAMTERLTIDFDLHFDNVRAVGGGNKDMNGRGDMDTIGCEDMNTIVLGDTDTNGCRNTDMNSCGNNGIRGVDNGSGPAAAASFGHTASLGRLVVIELKQDALAPSPMKQILAQLRVKPFKLSKYCIGEALTNPLVKHNRFKAKIRAIGKMAAHDSNINDML